MEASHVTIVLTFSAKRPKLAVKTPTFLPYSAKMAARIAKTQKDTVAAACSDVPSESSSEESESEPEDDPYDEAFTGGKGLPRGIWEHGRINAFGTRPRRKCAKAKEASRKSGPGTRSRPARQQPDAATASTSHASTSTAKSCAMPLPAGTRILRAAALTGLPRKPAAAIGGGLAKKSAAGLAAKSTPPSVPADAPTQRFQEFLISKNLVDDYLEYSTTISTSRKDFLRDQDLLKEWISFNP